MPEKAFIRPVRAVRVFFVSLFFCVPITQKPPWMSIPENSDVRYGRPMFKIGFHHDNNKESASSERYFYNSASKQESRYLVHMQSIMAEKKYKSQAATSRVYEKFARLVMTQGNEVLGAKC